MRAGVLTFKSQHQLDALRSRHRFTHVFHHSNQEQILCVPVVADAPRVGSEHEEIRLRDDLDLCAALIGNALLNYLYHKGRQSQGYDPIEIVGNESNENLLAASAPFGAPAWLAMRPLYELCVRAFHFNQQSPSVGLVLDVRPQRIIDLPCDELAAQGVALTGLTVGQFIGHDDVRLAPHFQWQGRVQQVVDDRLLLVDAHGDLKSTEASGARLEPSPLAFDRCLEHVFYEHTSRIKQELERQIAGFLSGPRRLQKLHKVIERLSRLRLEMAPGVTFTIQTFLAQKDGAAFPPTQNAPRPVYVFDAEETRIHSGKDRGLNEHGPYSLHSSVRSFTSTPAPPAHAHTPHPQICVLCQQHRKEQVEQFLQKWLHGIPSTKREKSIFDMGLLGKYRLDNVSLRFFVVPGNSAEAYQRAARASLEQQEQSGRRWNLALVQTDEFLQSLEGEHNPYLMAHAVFLAEQIPSHELPIETVFLRGKPLGYALNSMALAAYVKMGGIPWLLKIHPPKTSHAKMNATSPHPTTTNHAETAPTMQHELVVGLSSASIGSDQLSGNERVIGLTTVLNGDGNYWFSHLTPAVPREDYEAALLATLQATFNHVRSEANWQPGDSVRLVLHVGKTLGNGEINAVKHLVAKFQEYAVEFAFLHVVQDHPHLLFDQKQRGVQDYPSQMMKGAFAPARGGSLQLSEQEVLLCLSGAKEVERPSDGMPRPLLLRLHPDSSFRDMSYLTRQIFAFSCHSWRTFSPAVLPVTLLYANLIAQRLDQLASLSGSTRDVILGRVEPRQWFL